MSRSDAKELIKRAQRARDRRQPWNTILADAFRYAGPELDSGFQQIGSTVGAQRPDRQVYDSTAYQAARDAADQVRMILTPPNTRFLDARVDQNSEAAQFADLLDEAMDTFFSHLNASDFQAVVGAAYHQAQITAGCLQVTEAAAGSISAFDITAVPLAEIYPEQAVDPGRQTIWRIRRLPVALIEEQWPGVNIPPRLAERRRDDGTATVEIIEGAVWQMQERSFRYVVLWPDDDGHLLFEQEQNTSPWIYGGYSRTPGEVLSRGPVLAVLPDIRTLDKAVELLLKNASIAVTGIWQADDDGVINPSTIRLVPGAIIPKAVGSAGLQPLRMPGNFDVSQLVISELRARIRYAIMRREMPNLAKSHVTTNAIDREALEVELLRVPGLLVLWRELVVPLFRRCLDILVRRGEVFDLVDRIGRDVHVIAVSPWMKMQEMAQINDEAQAISLAAAVSPGTVSVVIDLPAWQADVVRRLGVPEKFIRQPDDIAESLQAQEQAAAVERTAEAAGRAAPALRAIGGQPPRGGGGR